MAIEFVADFETTAQRIYDIKTRKLRRDLSETWVCAWAYMPVELNPDESHIIKGRTLDDFMTALRAEYLKLSQSKKEPKGRRRPAKMTVFTHNLKFDGDFVMYWLLKDGVGYITNEVRENVLYSFTAHWDGIEVTFRDSLKIFPQSAAKIGELYGIEKLKGDWDYEKWRDKEGTTPISDQEWQYVFHDVMIISRALADYRAQGYVENTEASIAYNDRLRRTYPKFRKTLARSLKDKDYDRFLATFPDEIRPLDFELHRHLMLGYFGGISYLNPRYACQALRWIWSYDVHSMYPDKMRNARLPVGKPLIIQNPTQEEAMRMVNTYPCVMADIEHLTLRLKSEDHFPVLMFPTNRITSVRMEGKVIKCEDESATLTGLDIRMMLSEYDVISMTVTCVYFWSSKKGHYAAFVDHWMNIKQEADKVLNDDNVTPQEKSAAKTRRALAKVMMNASYGKDGTKLERIVKKTYYDEARDLLDCTDDVELVDIEYYLPSAIFICATARWQLWSAVKLVRPYFIYCDTDSIKVTEEGAKILQASPEFHIDDYELGAWGFEGIYETACFVRQKTYSYTQRNKKGQLERHYTVCGAPDDIKSLMKIDEFKPGMKITLEQIHSCTDSETGKPLQGRLLPVRVRGGVILEETGFQISKVDNWDERSGRNMPINRALLSRVLV